MNNNMANEKKLTHGYQYQQDHLTHSTYILKLLTLSLFGNARAKLNSLVMSDSDLKEKEKETAKRNHELKIL